MKTHRMNSGGIQASTCSCKLADSLTWLFCDELGKLEELRIAQTLGLDKKVNDCDQVLDDKRLLSKHCR